MEQAQLDYFKKMLEDKLAELLGEAGKTIEEMTAIEANVADPADRATLESERNFELRIRDRERKLIKKIQKALERIKDGSYGVCEECGEDIGVKRLEARPVTTLCIQCKSRQEQEEKAKGL